ncbi:Uncharacterised protein [Candidatus Tiddalikarchaeum anstoanum]|nr:Uncharacterised protein [Candidatus Tiddalikarchaeum anstoanum]
MVDQQDLLNQIEKSTSPYSAQSGNPEQQAAQPNYPQTQQYPEEPQQIYTPAQQAAPKKTLLDILTQVSYIVLGIVAVIIAILLLMSNLK